MTFSMPDFQRAAKLAVPESHTGRLIGLSLKALAGHIMLALHTS